MTTWAVLAVLLVLIGLLLLLAEALLPSGGLLTAMAVLCGGAGVALAFIKFKSPTFGVILIAGGLVLGPMVFLFGISRLPRTRLGKRIVLQHPDYHGWAAVPVEPDYQDLLGRRGVAVGPLRPAGIAEFDGRRYDVVTEGRMVGKGTAVRVIAVEANRVVVRPIEEEGHPTA